jgi:hypothetical protein
MTYIGGVHKASAKATEPVNRGPVWCQNVQKTKLFMGSFEMVFVLQTVGSIPDAHYENRGVTILIFIGSVNYRVSPPPPCGYLCSL